MALASRPDASTFVAGPVAREIPAPVMPATMAVAAAAERGETGFAVPAAVVDPGRAVPNDRRDTAPPSSLAPLDLNHLVERWDEVIESVRAAGRGMLASALGDALPVAVSGSGLITLQVDGEHHGDAEMVERALEGGAAELLDILGRHFAGITRVTLRRTDRPPASGGTRRLTEDALRAERMAKLRRRDPLLGKAIDVLDLELLD
jgi:hypothetical protein